MLNEKKDSFIVYKTTSLINSKIYIGVHKLTSLKDDYLGSGKALKRAIKKYGKNNFIRETLYTFDNEMEAYLKEKSIVSLEFINSRKNYNLTEGGKIPPKSTNSSISKSQNTKLKLYGSKSGILNSKEIRNKVKTNSLKKYGSEYGFLHNKKSSLKRNTTVIEKYGVLGGQMHSKKSREKSELTKKENREKDLLKTYPYLNETIVIYGYDTLNILWEGLLKGVNSKFEPLTTFYRNKKTINSVNNHLLGKTKSFYLGGVKCTAKLKK